MHVELCRRLAVFQYGVVARRQAFQAGMSPDAVKHLVQSGLWRRVLPATYALWLPASRVERRLQQLMAGTLWLGDDSGVSVRAAAMLWGLDGVKSAPLEFSTIRKKRYRRPGFVVHVVSVLPAADLRIVAGLRVTSVPRTLLDVGPFLRAGSLEMAVESAIRLDLVTITDLHAAVEGAPRTHPGRTLLRRILTDLPVVATDSELEVRTWQLFRESGLPMPIRQYVVRDEAGIPLAKVDFAYPQWLISVEADGYAHHSDKRSWARDRERANALTRLGWTIYRVTWEDVTMRPAATVAGIARMIEHRSGGWPA